MQHLTRDNFYHETAGSTLPVVVMFYASWCPKCAMMKPIVQNIEKVQKKLVRFFEVDVEESPELSAKYDTSTVPAFWFFQNGEPVGVMQGVISESTFLYRLKKIFRKS